VFLNRFWTDRQKLCRAAVGTAFGYQLQHTALPTGQRVEVRCTGVGLLGVQEAFDQLTRHIRAQILFALGNAANCNQQFFHAGVFENIAIYSHAQRRLDILFSARTREKQAFDLGLPMFDLRRHVKPTATRQANVHHHHIGVQFDGGLSNVAATAVVIHHQQVRLLHQERGQALSEQDVVVNQGNSNFHHEALPEKERKLLMPL